MQKGILFLAFAAIILSISLSSCKKDEVLTDSSVHLTFSEDTLMFDTVFVTAGSATQVFTVHNTNSRPPRMIASHGGHTLGMLYQSRLWLSKSDRATLRSYSFRLVFSFGDTPVMVNGECFDFLLLAGMRPDHRKTINLVVFAQPE